MPIVRADVGIERVSLWNERIGGARPLRSVWLTNSSNLTLDAGSFTVLEASTFAGEGLLDPIKPGEKRLLSYALDLGVQVDARRGDEQQRVSRIRIDRGTVVQRSEQVSRRVYTLRNNDVTARTVVIEHPARPGWTLAKGPVPVETSLGAYRFAVPLEPKATATLVASASDRHYTMRTPISRWRCSSTTRAKPAPVQALVGQAKKAESRRRPGDGNPPGRGERIADDQKRLRDNMGALKGSGEQQLMK